MPHIFHNAVLGGGFPTQKKTSAGAFFQFWHWFFLVFFGLFWFFLVFFGLFWFILVYFGFILVYFGIQFWFILAYNFDLFCLIFDVGLFGHN